MIKKNYLSCIVLILLLAAALLFASSCAFTVTVDVDTESAEKAPDGTVSDETSSEPDDTLAGCLFIGDSRTEGLKMAGSLPEADFFCAIGQTVFDITGIELPVDGLYLDLRQLLSGKEYRKVYILLGINEISADLDEVAEEFSRLIDLIRSYQPGAKIIIEANLHVTAWRSNFGDAFNNDNVDLLNQKLKAMTDGSSILWLDANPLLDDESGGLREEYAEEDGIHPNFGCYEMWGEWITAQNANY